MGCSKSNNKLIKMKIKNYLSVGAVIVGSAAMVACDGDDVTVTETTFELNESKAVAPVQLAQFPLTSLTLTFDTAGNSCVGTTFAAGDELEIDFDSVDVTSSDDTTADGFADLTLNGFIGGSIGGGTFTPSQAITGIISDPAATTWSIGSVGGLLADVTLTPYASDLRSITGRFETSTLDEVNINADADVTLVDIAGAPVITGTTSVNQVTLFADNALAANPGEIQSIDGTTELEVEIGTGNYALSLNVTTATGTCQLTFVIPKVNLGAADVLAPTAVEVLAYLAGVEGQALLSSTTLSLTSDALDELAATVAAPVWVKNANVAAPNVVGSYRQDFDSSNGTVETLINNK